MQKLIQIVTKILRNEFFIALFLLGAYLLTSPYIYGWDDQHLEIPILKHLIDPSLYKGDYYVEPATKYFTCWLYPILAKFITLKQIPMTYLVLFLISRYVMFYWVYRMWLFISGSCFVALSTMLTFLYLGRTDEFLYRSFCHEEFTFMFVFSGIYFFYRERYRSAALLFGLGVNFHAIYGLFPMLYLLTYLFFCHPKRFRMILQTGIIFVIAALPFLLWQIPISLAREVAHPVSVAEWTPLYYLSCPQNYIFGDVHVNAVWADIHIWWTSCAPYLVLMGFYIFNLVFNPLVRQDKRLHAIIGLSWALLGVAYYFDYIHPNRFVLDLNLIRVAQFMRLFIMGYTTVWACEQLRNSKPWLALTAVVLVLACGTADLTKLFFLSIVSMIFVFDGTFKPSIKLWKRVLGGVFVLCAGVVAYLIFKELKRSFDVHVAWDEYKYVMAGMGVIFLALLIKSNNQFLRHLLLIVVLGGTFYICVTNTFHYLQLKNYAAGPWEMLRDWKDIQLYVRDHTPKNALILTPYDMTMGGFRIHSERKALVCYRDCGIIGFDYGAAQEWQNRINDIKGFKVFTQEPVDTALLKAILKYKVDYVVFMKYYGPPGDTDILKKMYENSVFSLYQVL